MNLLQTQSVYSGSNVLDRHDLTQLAFQHACAHHPLFHVLNNRAWTVTRAGALLSNYNAHALLLRRLLLKAAGIMPEPVVGLVLENVRTEYGSGSALDRHELQLLDLAAKAGVDFSVFRNVRLEAGVRDFIKKVVPLYFPLHSHDSHRLYKPAIAAGAITATEILAVREFAAMQAFFAQCGLMHHIWFDHVALEVSHKEESIALAHYFMAREEHVSAVLYGFNGVLDANLSLYDGLLQALIKN